MIDEVWGSGMSQPAGFADKVAFVWKVADKLRGHFKPHEYGSVMLPLLVLRRLDAVLAPTKAEVLERAKGLDDSAGSRKVLERVAGQRFYNTSPLTFVTLLNDDKHVAASLRAYVNAFSPVAVEVLEEYRFDDAITRLDKAGILYQVLGDFADLDLHPDTVSNDAMGYIFEELLRRFSEMSNETAGEHYTPREVIRLMVDLLFAEDDEALAGERPVRSIYDPAAGTGGMLTVAQHRLAQRNAKAHADVDPGAELRCLSPGQLRQAPTARANQRPGTEHTRGAAQQRAHPRGRTVAGPCDGQGCQRDTDQCQLQTASWIA